MKEIKLNSMHVERFKGLFAFDVRFGEHTEISGRNALGKTCVYDAYLWCLFNKDSRGRVIDKVQTMDADGVADKDARTVVSVSFLIDDQQVEFRREFYQNWSKPRGKTEPVYNGNASDYFFNDVPLTLTEYNKKIQSYFDKDKFELVSNINLFASYDTAKRRAILEEIADIESLTKLIASDYPVVQQAMREGKTVEEFQIELRKKAAKVKAEAEDIPVRIDEIERSIPAAPNCDALRAEKDRLVAKQEEHQKKIDDYRKAALLGASSELRKELNAVVDRISGLTREAQLAKSKEFNAANEKHNALTLERNAAVMLKQTYDSKLAVAEKDVEQAKDEFAGIRAEWTALNETDYVSGQPLTECPTCGHMFTPEELAENEGRAVQIFNRDKLDRLAKLEAKAKTVKAHIDVVVGVYNDAKKKCDEQAREVARINGLLDELAKTPVVVKSVEERLSANPEYVKLTERRTELEAKLAANQPQTYDEEIQQEKKAMLGIAAEIGGINSELAKEQQIKNARARIEQLNSQERTLGQEKADLEQKLDELAAFSSRKMNAIEERINALFQYVKIRMFEKNLTNDGTKDICDITVDGIPYSVLNTASRINAGIDICRTLALAYEFRAPIWVDNAESVNRILGGDCQLVTLRVTEEANLTTQIM